MFGNKTFLAIAAVAALSLSGCGTNQGDRAASGALIGAGAGAILGAAAGNPGMGAAAGAVAGGVIGAATNPCDLNLGDPVWSNDRGSYERRCGRPYRER
jgi:osmotically inducible lipoprotein OsmB